MAKCKHETQNGRCGLKESYAYRHKCYSEECCKCHESIESCGYNEPITNADRIRAMSDEELAEILVFWNDDLGRWETDVGSIFDDSMDEAIKAELEWLQQPVGDE